MGSGDFDTLKTRATTTYQALDSPSIESLKPERLRLHILESLVKLFKKKKEVDHSERTTSFGHIFIGWEMAR
ncbi:hypothetical protein DsansV1_C29g0211641 [Dioscorea sansibarensis]